jgi:hypothetical protein
MGLILLFGFIRYGVVVAWKEGYLPCLFYSPLIAMTILIFENLGRLTGLMKRLLQKPHQRIQLAP